MIYSCCYCFVVFQSKAAYVLFYQRQETGFQESMEEKQTGQAGAGQDADIDMLHDSLWKNDS